MGYDIYETYGANGLKTEGKSVFHPHLMITNRFFVRTTQKGLAKQANPFLLLVPEARIELARTQGPLDFESSASTNFTTPALKSLYSKLSSVVNSIDYCQEA